MSRLIIKFILMTLSLIVLVSTFSCASSVSQKEYDGAVNELNIAKSRAAELQGKLDESSSQVTALQQKLNETMAFEKQYRDLNTQYEELKKQRDAQIGEIQSLNTRFNELNTRYEQLKAQDAARLSEAQAIKAQYDSLNKEYDELKKQYDIVVQGAAVLNEEDISQAIFELINQERVNSGVAELIWGVNLYSWANQNSQEMAEQGKYVYSGAGAIWQDVFMAVRYGTIDQIANAALTVWKVNDYSYRYNIINPQAIYGAVATYKSGEVYYITYISSIFR